MPDDAEAGDQPSSLQTPECAQLEREQWEQERLASLSKLARGVAHDFNNFLMVILGQAEIGRTTPADSPAQAQFSQILTASRRAAELCRQLMAYAGHAQLSQATVDLAALLRETIAEARTALNATCELRGLSTTEKLPLVEADKAQLHAAIANAIRNACEALPPQGGVVTVIAGTIDADRTYLQKFRPATLVQPGSYLFVEVADNGCGMDEETLARIFDPFFSTKKARPGMGLSSLLGVVRSHRGAVHVTSAVGQGTTLRILLPVAADAQELAARLRGFLAD